MYAKRGALKRDRGWPKACFKSTGFGDPLNEKWRSRSKRTMALKWHLGISDFIHLDFSDTSKGGTWDLRNSSCDIASAEVHVYVLP